MSDLVRYSPFAETLDRLFRAPTEALGWGGSTFSPTVDVTETDDQYIIRMDVPGVKRDDLNIEMRDNMLTVRGHREYNTESNRGDLMHVERGYGTFQRSIALPRGVENIDAELEDGVLVLAVAKPAEAQPRKIEIADRKLIEA